MFLVSDLTKRYYSFQGFDRVLKSEDEENEWYYRIRNLDQKFNLVIDNDEVAGAKNAITVFVNARILNASGEFLGVVGVGLTVDHFQTLIREYENEFDVTVSLINEDGTVALSSDHYGYGLKKIDYFKDRNFSEAIREKIISWKENGKALEFWVGKNSNDKSDYLVTRYFSELEWHLVVERDTDDVTQSLNAHLICFVAVISFIIASILIIVTFIVTRYNRRIVSLTKMAEEQRKSAFEEVTGRLFDNIYMLDITGNKAGNRATEEYFESLGVPKKTPFDRSLKIVAEKQIKEEFRAGYVNTFCPENVLKEFEAGHDSLSYEFMITGCDGEYHWMRIVVQIVRSEKDGKIQMYSYRQNIDAEKKRERKMHLLATTDEMTGLLNKVETERRIDALLKEASSKKFAFYIFDIDCFKTANDRFGHAFGDLVIIQFADILKQKFDNETLKGRIGGDEFVIFCQYNDEPALEEKTKSLLVALCSQYKFDGTEWMMSASIGLALAPKDGRSFSTLYKKADSALYQSKKRGKNSYTFYKNS